MFRVKNAITPVVSTLLLACALVALVALAACSSPQGSSTSGASGASGASSVSASVAESSQQGSSQADASSSGSASGASPSSDSASSAAPSAAADAADTASVAHPAILYQGKGSVRIVTPEGKVIYVDPFAGEDAWYELPADLILVTHDHFDHNKLERVAQRNDGCSVVTQAEAVVNGEHPTFEFDFAKVVPVQAGFNDNHDVRSCVGYVIELTDGTKVYLTGDTSTTDQMRDGTLAAMGIDYAFWCCDGVYNMDAGEAAEAAGMVGAAHNIPYHNTPSNKGEAFDREAAAAFAAPNAMVVVPGQEIAL